MTSADSILSPKDIVKALMTFEGKESKPSLGGEKHYLLYKCPKPGCSNPVVTFLANSGYQNPYRHLLSCFGKGQSRPAQISKVNKLFIEARNLSQKNGGTIRSHFDCQMLSEYELAMYGYMRLIVMKNLPVDTVEDEDFRTFSKFKVHINIRTLDAVIFQLVELVEELISKEIKNTRGALMYDGWTSNNTHFIGVFLSYCLQVPIRIDGKEKYKHIPQITLIGVSPLAKIDEDDDDGLSQEATKFNAEAHLTYFREIFEYYNCDFDRWTVCLIGDNVSTNVKIASLCAKPHIGCVSHKLNLEVTFMVQNDTSLRNTINSVHCTMKAAKTKLKSAAILRNLTKLRPILHNKTRWSSKYDMIARFTRIRNKLIEASQSNDAEIPIAPDIAYGSKVSKYENMLSEINVATKMLQ